MADYNWPEIDRLKEQGHTWPEIAEDYNVTPGTIRKANSRRKGRAKDSPKRVSQPEPERENESVFFVRVVQIR